VPASEAAPPADLSTFIEELDTCEDLDQLRPCVASAIGRRVPCQRLVLLEATEDRSLFAVTWSSAQDGARPAGQVLRADDPLARWLRVNATVLRLGVGERLWDEWSEADRGLCASLNADVALPFVASDELVAIALLAGTEGLRVETPSGAVEVEAFTRYVAARWRQMDQRARADARQKSLHRAQQLSAVGQLASTIAHEVRNPMAAVRSLVQFLHEVDPDPRERNRLLRMVIAEADRVAETVERMLSLSRPHDDDDSAVDMASVVDEVTRFVTPYARRRHVEVSARTATLPCQVRGDRDALRQVLMNVLMNACQACAGGGHVTVTLEAKPAPAAGGQTVSIEVTDDGVGIPAEEIGRVFDPFVTTKVDGTGLGLTFCRDALARIGGGIELRSVAGKGSTVLIAIPGMAANGACPDR
jgi:signal transduction histidine kinase